MHPVGGSRDQHGVDLLGGQVISRVDRRGRLAALQAQPRCVSPSRVPLLAEPLG